MNKKMLSRTVIYGGIAATLVLSLLSIYVVQPKDFENSRYGVFVKVLSNLAFILVALGLILTAEAFEEGQKLTKVGETYRLIDRSLMKQIEYMQKHYEKAPHFIQSLWPQQGLWPNPPPANVKDDPAAVLEITFYMMQSFEDHFTGATFDATGEYVWAGNYLQWASSDKFYEMYKMLYPNFKQSTNEYADLLFEYAKRSPIKTSKDLLERALEFSKDKRVDRIYELIKAEIS